MSGRMQPCHPDRSIAIGSSYRDAEWRDLLLHRTASTTNKFIFVFATILIFVLPCAAKSWRVSNFQDNITVNPDGSALVNETITLNFDGIFHGINRTIPIQYPGP